MKKIVFSIFIISLALGAFSQPLFNLGLKAGLNNSKVTLNINDYDSESILRMHIGAFARLGWGRIYLQPEAYFSSKGGEISSSLFETATQFDFNNVDVPLLIGVKVIQGESANVRVMAGPVFSFVTTGDTDPDSFLDPQFYKDNYYGFQYGVGFDISKFFLDVRMEHGSSDLYYHPSLDINGKNQTFMVTAGFRIF